MLYIALFNIIALLLLSKKTAHLKFTILISFNLKLVYNI